MAAECVIFRPHGGGEGLQTFIVNASDGPVTIGRSAITGISSKFVSRSWGLVWCDDEGAWLQKNAAGLAYVYKWEGEGEEIPTGEPLRLRSGE